MMIAWKMWPLEWKQGFPLIWPGDLVFDPRWPSFELDLEIIKTNILSKIPDDCLNKSSRCFLANLESIGLLVQEKKQKIDFQDGCHGGHLGFPIGMILAIFDL